MPPKPKPKPKPQAASRKPKPKPQAASRKPQAASRKPQAASSRFHRTPNEIAFEPGSNRERSNAAIGREIGRRNRPSRENGRSRASSVFRFNRTRPGGPRRAHAFACSIEGLVVRIREQLPHVRRQRIVEIDALRRYRPVEPLHV
ncbi:hypothetical protein DF122_16095 [Burkholderia pseudomallei]|nr:hypothetical protein DF127_11245 [Burkholderia pseudomallei]RSK63882.1 hypothetical protein DF122_16095 [Burkholderia pseudomallei]